MKPEQPIGYLYHGPKGGLIFVEQKPSWYAEPVYSSDSLLTARNQGRDEAAEEMQSLEEVWAMHEALCDVWGGDNSYEDAVVEFRALLKSWGWDNFATVTPDFAGSYITAMTTYALRDYMSARTALRKSQGER